MIDTEFQETIRNKKIELFKLIEDSNAELEKLRIICEHPTKESCNYSYRPGSMFRAVICSDCGELFPDEIPSMYDLVN